MRVIGFQSNVLRLLGHELKYLLPVLSKWINALSWPRAINTTQQLTRSY